jgi:hypothetical protein
MTQNSRMPRKTEALRSAFQFEVRPDVYAGRIWTTAIIVGLGLVAIYCFKDGNVDLKFVAPVGGFTPRNPEGVLYVERWQAILTDSLQIGFGLWGVELLVRSVYRLAREFKFAPAGFSLGIAFLTFAYFVPALLQALVPLVTDHYPFLKG